MKALALVLLAACAQATEPSPDASTTAQQTTDVACPPVPTGAQPDVAYASCGDSETLLGLCMPSDTGARCVLPCGPTDTWPQCLQPGIPRQLFPSTADPSCYCDGAP